VVVRRGDVGEEVKALRRGLNKDGGRLLVDSPFGAGVTGAMADPRTFPTAPGPAEVPLVDAIRGVGSNEHLTQMAAAVIPLPAATAIFTTSTLLRFLAQTRSVLVSLVYNRGGRRIDRASTDGAPLAIRICAIVARPTNQGGCP
jgi:hypothetical protein